jgi:hypothetical protein
MQTTDTAAGTKRSEIVYRTWSVLMPDAERVLGDVQKLAKLNKKTLGFLPDAAFSDRALAGTLAIAIRNEELVGYALYSLPRSHIKLTHVCSVPSVRGSGLGAGLIEYIVERHPERTGLIAHCRRDYELNGFWKSAGLSPHGDKPGRSIAGHLLTTWWRPLGGPTLFDNFADESSLPQVVLDANIVIDLYASDAIPRESREASRALLSDWLAAEINISVSGAVDSELDRTVDTEERARQKTGAQHLHRLPTSRPKDRQLEQELLRHIGPVELRRDLSLSDDVNHVADAIRASSRYFVTNDSNLIRLTKKRLADEYDLKIVRPHELVDDFFNREVNHVRFVSGVFEQVELTWRPADSRRSDLLERNFLNYSEGERGRSFRQSLRSALANPQNETVELLYDEDGAQLALVSSELLSDRLEVRLLRVARHHLAESLAFQIARMLRARAVQGAVNFVRIVDQHPQGRVRDALLEDGFHISGRSYVAETIDEQHETTGGHGGQLKVNGRLISAPTSASATALLERDLWPLKLWDEHTPCLVVPIKPYASMDLLGYPAGLLSPRTSLGLSRRHVYYRSGRDNPFKDLPARILWYASANRGAATQRFFAVSRLIRSEVVDAGEAHELHSNLGVFNRRAVIDAADKRGRTNVLEFEDSELLPEPITLDQFRKIGEPYGVVAEFQSPRKIPNALFKELMRKTYELSDFAQR